MKEHTKNELVAAISRIMDPIRPSLEGTTPEQNSIWLELDRLRAMILEAYLEDKKPAPRLGSANLTGRFILLN